MIYIFFIKLHCGFFLFHYQKAIIFTNMSLKMVTFIEIQNGILIDVVERSIVTIAQNSVTEPL